MGSKSITLDESFEPILKRFKNEIELEEYLKPTGIILIRTNDGRILFTSDLWDTSIPHYRARYEARGIVYDPYEYKILAKPPISLKYYEHIKKQPVLDAFDAGKYSTIEEAKDGTSITLYSFGGRLQMGTAKSCDVSNADWVGGESFVSMFHQTAQCYPEFIKATELQLNENDILQWNIPTKYCVTLGFRNHNIHPDRSDPPAMWLLQIYNLETNQTESLPGFESLEAHKKIDLPSNFDDLIAKCNRNIMINSKQHFYGYILTESDTNDKIFMPSNLYTLYQYFFYSFKQEKDVVLQNNERYRYSILKNVLGNKDDSLILLETLIPNYADFIGKIKSFISLMTSRALTRLKDREYGNSEPWARFVDEILHFLRSDEPDLDVNNLETYKLVSDYIKDPKHTMTLLGLYKDYESDSK